MVIQKLRPSVQIRILKSLHGTLYVYFIFNDTYKAKDKLRELGFKFDPNIKTWFKVLISMEKHKEMLKKLRTFLTFNYPEPENGKYPEFFELFEKNVKEKYNFKKMDVIGYWCKNRLEDDFFMQLKNFEYNFSSDCFTTKPMLLHPVIKIQKKPSSVILPFSQFVNETSAILQTNNRSIQYDLVDIKELRETRVLFLQEITGWHKNDNDVIRYIIMHETLAFPVCLNNFYDKVQRKCKRFEGVMLFGF